MSKIMLWHGDSIEMMKRIPDESIDLVLTDPSLWDYRLQMGYNYSVRGYVGTAEKSHKKRRLCRLIRL